MSTTQEILDQLNAWEEQTMLLAAEPNDPDKVQQILAERDVWQNVILGLDEYDETAEASQASSGDRFATRDGTVIRYDGSRQVWYEQH